MSDSNSFDESRKEAMKHAWDWFALHATQRMQSVNYFLVAAAFLFAAFTTVSKDDKHALALGISVLGACLSYVFYRLERRVRSLIHAAEHAIEPLEKELATVTQIPALEIVSRVRTPMPGTWVYSKVFRWLYASSGLAFVLGFLYSVWRLASGVPVFAPAFFVTAQLMVGVFFGTLGAELLFTKDADDKISRSGTVRNTLFVGLGFLFLLTSLCVLLHLVFWQLPSVLHTP
jgi:hypothetical protein